jgi:hypothetical protein
MLISKMFQMEDIEIWDDDEDCEVKIWLKICEKQKHKVDLHKLQLQMLACLRLIC